MIKKAALRYLGYGSQKASQQVEILLDECIEEIKQTAQPKAAAALFHLDHEPLCIHETGDLIPGKQMEELLADCEKCLLTGGTLGTAMERKIKMYEKVNMTKAVVMDAAASAYLEVFCDEYEENLGFPDRTYRACPGYGDFPIEFNKKIANFLNGCIKKIRDFNDRIRSYDSSKVNAGSRGNWQYRPEKELQGLRKRKRLPF